MVTRTSTQTTTPAAAAASTDAVKPADSGPVAAVKMTTTVETDGGVHHETRPGSGGGRTTPTPTATAAPATAPTEEDRSSTPPATPESAAGASTGASSNSSAASAGTAAGPETAPSPADKAMEAITGIADKARELTGKLPRVNTALTHVLARAAGLKWRYRPGQAARVLPAATARNVQLSLSSLRYDAAGVSEGLLRLLFDLDAVIANGNPGVRKARKQQVVAVQQAIEKADAVKSRAFEVGQLVEKVLASVPREPEPEPERSPVDNATGAAAGAGAGADTDDDTDVDMTAESSSTQVPVTIKRSSKVEEANGGAAPVRRRVDASTAIPIHRPQRTATTRDAFAFPETTTNLWGPARASHEHPRAPQSGATRSAGRVPRAAARAPAPPAAPAGVPATHGAPAAPPKPQPRVSAHARRTTPATDAHGRPLRSQARYVDAYGRPVDVYGRPTNASHAHSRGAYDPYTRAPARDTYRHAARQRSPPRFAESYGRPVSRGYDDTGAYTSPPGRGFEDVFAHPMASRRAVPKSYARRAPESYLHGYGSYSPQSPFAGGFGSSFGRSFGSPW